MSHTYRCFNYFTYFYYYIINNIESACLFLQEWNNIPTHTESHFIIDAAMKAMKELLTRSAIHVCCSACLFLYGLPAALHLVEDDGESLLARRRERVPRRKAPEKNHGWGPVSFSTDQCYMRLAKFENVHNRNSYYTCYRSGKAKIVFFFSLICPR